MTKQQVRDINQSIASGGLWMLLQFFSVLDALLDSIGDVLLFVFRHAPTESSEEYYYSPSTYAPDERTFEKAMNVEADDGIS